MAELAVDTAAPTGATPAEADPRVPPRWRSALTDSLTMTGRSLRLSRRNLEAILTSLLLPVLLMLLFVYLFGGAIQTGTEYVTYVVPGVLLLSAGFGASMTAVTVSNDMTGGIIDRFRSLDVAGAAILAGHVAASVVRNLASTVLVFGVAFLIGFRPSAGPLDWLAAAAVLLLFIGAISWLSAAVGLLARSPEAAGGFVPGELPALPQQRLRTGRDHADVAPRGRRQPAGHPGHRDPARPAPGPCPSGPARPRPWPGAWASWSPRWPSRACCSAAARPDQEPASSGPTWTNSTVLGGDVVEEVAKLRQRRAGDIVIHGSAQLVQTLVEHDLIDKVGGSIP